jgi:transposase
MLLGLAAQFGLRWNVTILAAARSMSGVRPAALSVAGPAFAEVEISEPVIAAAPAPSVAQHDGQIGIELPSGVRLTVDAAVDADALARVIAVLVR